MSRERADKCTELAAKLWGCETGAIKCYWRSDANTPTVWWPAANLRLSAVSWQDLAADLSCRLWDKIGRDAQDEHLLLREAKAGGFLYLGHFCDGRFLARDNDGIEYTTESALIIHAREGGELETERDFSAYRDILATSYAANRTIKSCVTAAELTLARARKELEE